MGLAIVYTPTAKNTLKVTYLFISEKFGKRTADKFLTKTQKTIFLIAEQPLMFKSSEIDTNVRMAYISKQCTLFYRVTTLQVQLLYFWDNRQEPIL